MQQGGVVFSQVSGVPQLKESKEWVLYKEHLMDGFPPNLFRGQRAMMHIPESSAGEAFHPLFVILPSREESLLYICLIYGSSVAIFVIITWMIELKLREENCVHVRLLQKAKQSSCSPLLFLDFTIIDQSRELWTNELVKGFSWHVSPWGFHWETSPLLLSTCNVSKKRKRKLK